MTRQDVYIPKRRVFGLKTIPALLALVVLTAYAAFPTDADDTRRTIEFAGRQWYVKAGIGLGPGNNNWSDDSESVWVDDAGQLHLRIRNIDGMWYSAQVIAVDDTGYGMYRFFVETPLNDLDEHVVVGLFLYRDDNHELDIEISHQGQVEDDNALFAVQPYFLEGHRESFTLDWDGPTIHEIEWQAENVRFATLQDDESAQPVIHEWLYEGDGIPRERHRLRIQINLWLTEPAPANEEEVEIVISGVDAPTSSE
jgi:hypothetical protein